jgi:D-beta-D-heptose 7-phosphate kinase/D-beta-D-heptose 1-phosphate adenosyltransferase
VKLIESLERLAEVRVLVVGDVMLDRYFWGDVERISPEAPVPVVNVLEKTEVIGGAGNAAFNLAGLGCPTVLIGVRGNDARGRRLEKILEDNSVEGRLLVDSARPTITKTRVITQGQQLIRLDEERPENLSSALAGELLGLVEDALPSCKALLLSDYGKGVLQTPGFAEALIKLSQGRGLPVLVDPKGYDWKRYQNATCVTPNAKELEAVAGSKPLSAEADLTSAAQSILKRYQFKWLLVTRGALGMYLVGQEESPLVIPGIAREVYDVSGAGDTVVATVAAGVGSGLPFPDAARLSNLAAGIVVGKLGTQPISLAELKTAILMRGLDDSQIVASKLSTLDAIRLMVQTWRANGERIVFTNGCFDLLHPGHIHLLNRARALGDRLVVGLNSDRSVRRLKGANRPILSEEDRAALLGALTCVDAIVLFNEDTPLNLIETLKPDILAKGADYQNAEVIGREVVEAYGGEVALVPVLEGYSTTGIVDRVSNDNGS